jgi:cyclopropane fatty-acyl-phospholipid synthase-like methyltransferase
MSESTDRSAANSLETNIKLLPHMPFLLQDLWALGCSIDDILDCLEIAGFDAGETHLLDLGCGKGAVSVRTAARFSYRMTGIDIMTAFLEDGREKAREYGVSHLCTFEKTDMREYVKSPHEYDGVILASLGGILGSIKETVSHLRTQVRSGGYMLIDDGYLRSAESFERKGYEYYRNHADTIGELTAFNDSIVKEVNTTEYSTKINYEYLESIKKQAGRLIGRHPELKDDIQAYIDLQAEECDIIRDHTEGALWLIRKNDSE